MSENSKIEWCHDTRNLWWGCKEKSTGCAHCFAKGVDKQYAGGLHWGANAPRLAIKGVWNGFKKSQRLAVKTGKKRRVFVGSMMDIFEKDYPLIDREGNKLEETTHQLRLRYFNEVIPATPNLYHLLLTKRPENIWQTIPMRWAEKFPDNVWFGVSVENQEMADIRIPELLKIPAKVRFLSCEPLLESVELGRWIGTMDCSECRIRFWGDQCPKCRKRDQQDLEIGFAENAVNPYENISWVIIGGESGPRRRHFDPNWARSIRDQCQEASVPFFMKQTDKIKPIPDDLMIREFPNV